MREKEYPMTFNQFTTQFASEEQCRRYLYNLQQFDLLCTMHNL